jgi:DNA polymerase-3 subunit beta
MPTATVEAPPVAAPKTAAAKTDVKLMELAVNQETLLAEVAAVARVAETRTTQPILTHLLLEAEKDGVLRITASDLERTLVSECPAQIKTPGAAAISAQKFLDYVKLLTKGPISLKVLANQYLQVQAGASRTRMHGLSPTEFPARPTPATEVIRLSSRALKTVIRQSLFAVATSEDRYTFNAGLLLLREDRVGMVATDGHRLSLVEMIEDEKLVDTMQKTLLPRGCMTDLLAVLNSSKEESVEFGQDERHVHFRIGPRLLSVRKLIGQFPNYEAIIPRENTNFTLVRTGELMTSVQRVLEFADARTNAVKLLLQENMLTISSASPESGESEETLSVNYGFPAVAIGFNGSYLLEFLKTIGAEGEVRIALKDGSSAAVITPERMNPEYRQMYICMPMRI